VRLAEYQEAQGDLDRARTSYQRALQANPEAAPVMVKLARLHAEGLGDLQQAVTLARGARTLAPEDPQIAHLLGRLAYRMGDYRQSLDLLLESDRRAPRQPRVLYDLAQSQFSNGRIAEARRSMELALEANGDFALAEDARRFVIMVRGYENDGLLREAEVLADEMLRQDPGNTLAQLIRARGEERRGNLDEALRIYEGIVAKKQLFAPGAKALAVIYAERLEAYDQAFRWATRARSMMSDDPEVAKLLGKIMYHRGEYSGAARLLEESARSRSQDAELYYVLGLTRHQMKDRERTREALNRALQLDPENRHAEEAGRVLAEYQ
jgi:tetratricopeptide (TPR) repeat protein